MYWNLFGGLLQDSIIRDAKRAADASRDDAKRSLTVASELKVAIERLVLVNRAIWELVAARHGISERELDDKVQEIDLRDGVHDARYRPPIRECSACRRTMSVRHSQCLYCGHQDERDPFAAAKP
jgi:hypothetical protein